MTRATITISGPSKTPKIEDVGPSTCAPLVKLSFSVPYLKERYDLLDDETIQLVSQNGLAGAHIPWAGG